MRGNEGGERIILLEYPAQLSIVSYIVTDIVQTLEVYHKKIELFIWKSNLLHIGVVSIWP